MTPIVVLEKGADHPTETPAYLVGKEGVFLRKTTPLFIATVPVTGVSRLQPVTAGCEMIAPAIPGRLLAQALLFFRRVYTQHHHSEAVVLLHYNPEEHTYALTCPVQTVSPGAAKYEATDRLPNHVLAGTIHSHGAAGASHSMTDSVDESDADGIHITAGDMGCPYFTLSCSVVVNGTRFAQPPLELVSGLRRVENWSPTRPGIYRREVVRGPWNDGVSLVYADPTQTNNQTRTAAPREFYDIVLPDGLDYRHVGVPTSRMSRVSPEPWRPLNGAINSDLLSLLAVGGTNQEKP